MAGQFVEVKEAADAVFIQARLVAHLIPAEEGGYVAHCPSLDIVSQGDTVAEARANIKEAIELVLESHFADGTLARRLADCGLANNGRKSASRKKRRAVSFANADGVREIRVPAKIPLTAAI